MATIANPSANFAADIIDNGKASGQQILVIGLCMFLNMLDGFDITAMSIVNTAVGSELQLTPDRLGLISSAALFGMACGGPIWYGMRGNVSGATVRYFRTSNGNHQQCLDGKYLHHADSQCKFTYGIYSVKNGERSWSRRHAGQSGCFSD